ARALLGGRAAGGVAGTVVAAGCEGRGPGVAERRRLLAAGAGVAFIGGAVTAGPLAGFALATAGPWAASRVLCARRERYRSGVEAGAAGRALALAGALRGGHSL